MDPVDSTPIIDCTFILDQNSTAVSIRSGLGTSASAASILSGQISTAVKDNPYYIFYLSYLCRPLF